MNINLNITLSVIFNGKQTVQENETALIALESAITRLQAKYGTKPTLDIQTAPSGNSGLNRAYLESQGKRRTPEVTAPELALRVNLPTETDWTSLEERHKALLTIGYDIFNPARNLGKNVSGDTGETYSGEVDISEVAE
jgi:hypothetical protein